MALHHHSQRIRLRLANAAGVRGELDPCVRLPPAPAVEPMIPVARVPHLAIQRKLLQEQSDARDAAPAGPQLWCATVIIPESLIQGLGYTEH